MDMCTDMSVDMCRALIAIAVVSRAVAPGVTLCADMYIERGGDRCADGV